MALRINIKHNCKAEVLRDVEIKFPTLTLSLQRGQQIPCEFHNGDPYVWVDAAGFVKPVYIQDNLEIKYDYQDG